MRRVMLAAGCVLGSLLLAMPGTARAEDLEHKEAKVKVTLPDKGWAGEYDDDVLDIHTDDESVHITFALLDGTDWEKALEEVGKVLGEEFESVTLGTDHVEEVQNGLYRVGLQGHGTVEGEKIEFGILVVDTPSEKILLVVGFAAASELKKHEKTVDKILDSIAPIEKGWKSKKQPKKKADD